jgi:hypothetical protein
MKFPIAILYAAILMVMLPDLIYAQDWRPAPVDLGTVLFVHQSPVFDRDNDGLRDSLELKLAEAFKPAFIFDSSEHHRRNGEPVTLFQVRPTGCIGSTCSQKPNSIALKFALLYAKDGGYGPSSDCTDAHNGDNQSVDFKLQSDDGRVWKLVEIDLGPFKYKQLFSGQSNHKRHVSLFLSAHKHHHYFDTSNDHKDSAYSDFGCNDDVNGNGARISPKLFGEVCRKLGISGGVQTVGCTEMVHNVGEPEAHDSAFFVGPLDSFGFHGEDAWSNRHFKGGLGPDGGDTSSLRSMWFKGAYTFGPNFSQFVPAEKLLGTLQLPIL